MVRLKLAVAVIEGVILTLRARNVPDVNILP